MSAKPRFANSIAHLDIFAKLIVTDDTYHLFGTPNYIDIYTKIDMDISMLLSF